MRILTLDVGTSAVKAALHDDDIRIGSVVRAPVTCRYEGVKAELDAEQVWSALKAAVGMLGPEVRSVRRVALDVLAPGFTVMDSAGRPTAPVIIHQDRRSYDEAAEIERRVGRDRHIALLGCRPFPGGIATSSLLWLRRHAPHLLEGAALFGQLSTFLVRRLTGRAVVDPGNATFLGLLDTFGETGWSAELCAANEVDPRMLPGIVDGGSVAGTVTAAAAEETGLPAGAGVLAGVIDTTAAMCSVGLSVGQLFNSVGTTDVLAIVTDRPRPGPEVLTRAVGVGRAWVTVYTIAAGGGALEWAHRNLYADLPRPEFHALLREVASETGPSDVTFEPYLAGDRLSLQQRTASFGGLTMSRGRREMLRAILEAWAAQSAEGMRRLSAVATPLPDVYITGGGAEVGNALRSRWPGDWRFHYLEEAGLTGLAKLAMRAG